MQQLKQLSLTLAALLCMATGAWALPENDVTVTPVTGKTNQWTFKMPAGNVELTPIYAPEFTATFKAGNDLTIQGGKATVTVTESGATEGTDVTANIGTDGKLTPLYEGQTITLTAAPGYKFKSVEAKKGVGPYANAKLGDLFYSDGTFSSTLVAGKTPIGVIAYLDQEGTDDDEICEKSNGAGHGLVMCLKNAAASTIAWSTESVSKFSGQEVTSVDGLKRTTNVSGYTNTATLTADAETAAKYPAAKAAKEYTTLAAPTGTTGWFLPSAQQWVKMQTGLGALEESSIPWNSWFDNNHEGADKWEAALSKAGSGNYDSMTSANLYYWSSSENSASYAVSLNVCAIMVGYGFNWYFDEKNPTGSSFRVRPVLAF
ncbi:MAG: hypothetical protein IKN75_07905 [Prevotella sp.]|nr:hypothetical protein [Prevotella sp.]